MLVTVGLLGVLGYLYMEETTDKYHDKTSGDENVASAPMENEGIPGRGPGCVGCTPDWLEDDDLVHTPASLDPYTMNALNPPVTALSPSTKNQSRDLRGDVTIPHATDHDTNDFLNPHLTDKLKFTVCASAPVPNH